MIEEVKKTADIILKGGIVLYPTDTVWGIGCDATNENAVKRIFEIKKREDYKAMLVLMDSANRLDRYIEEVPEIAYDLIEVADKPLTIIYPGAKNVASNLTAPDKSLGIRITQEAFSKKLCEILRKPIVSTSANPSGEKAPSFFDEITDEIKKQVDYIVQYRREDKTKSRPSQIIKLGIKGEVEIIRQ